MKRFIHTLTTIILMVSVFTSCIAENDIEPGGGSKSGKTAEISFLVSTPPTTQIKTRGQTGSTPENNINDIYVLAFDKSTGDLVSKSEGKNLTIPSDAQNKNKITFKATLPVGTEYTFMVLANAKDKLTSINTGMNPSKKKSDVLALTVTNTGRWDYSASDIPMWGEKDLNLTASDTPSFELVRMLARVNVEVNLNDINGMPADNFELTSIRYYNYNTVGALVPFTDNYDFSTNTTLDPTIPTEPATQTGSALTYNNDGSNTDIEDGKLCKEKIYIFEAAHNDNTYNSPPNNTDWIENPCLIIGGKYTTPSGTVLNETFYRVDFIRKDITDPNNIQETWLSILRNFSYNVTIVEVSGSGFEDPDIALRSAPVNMEANILEWDEVDMGDIAFDGTFFLSVSKDKFAVGSAGVTQEFESNILYVKTDYVFNNDPSHASSGWYVEKYVDKDTDDPVSWLQLNPESATPDPNNKVKTYFTFDENDSGAPRTAIVWIAAGRLRYPVEVTQRLAWIEIVDPVNGYIALEELRFEVPSIGAPSETKLFTVNWGPSGEPISINQITASNWFPFEPQYLDPRPDPSWTLTGIGSRDYVVNAPAIDASTIAQDPFYERESIYEFTIGTGANAETASILLHQIHYNIVVDLYKYQLDGYTYNINVRSNTEWVITNVEEWLYNKPPAGEPTPVLLDIQPTDNLRIGTTGGPNVGGESVSFTVVNQSEPLHEKKWGTVYVSFKSPTGKFPLHKIAIVFPARAMRLLTLGWATDVRAYNVGFPDSRHNQGGYRMLTAEANFGPTLNSTIMIEPFQIFAYNCYGDPRPGPEGKPFDNWYAGAFRGWLNTHNPDVIIMTYNMRMNKDDRELLKKYLENGGAVIMLYGSREQYHVNVRDMARTLFSLEAVIGDLDIREDVRESVVYKIPDINDPIFNGPFGDLRGKNWGSHLKHFAITTSKIQDQVFPLIEGKDILNLDEYTYMGTVMLRHKTMNLFWCLNGEMAGGYYREGSTYHQYDPMWNKDDFTPMVRPGFGYYAHIASLRHDVYNSFLFLNSVAWAIDVTRHTPPNGGY